MTRSFSEVEAFLGGAITVSVNLRNAELDDLRGIYYADRIPEGLSLETVTVRIGGEGVSDYRFESGGVGEVYPGCRAFRWILEIPDGFQEENPVPPGSTMEILYRVRSGEE